LASLNDEWRSLMRSPMRSGIAESVLPPIDLPECIPRRACGRERHGVDAIALRVRVTTPLLY